MYHSRNETGSIVKALIDNAPGKKHHGLRLGYQLRQSRSDLEREPQQSCWRAVAGTIEFVN
jgi:hypothetical protein